MIMSLPFLARNHITDTIKSSLHLQRERDEISVTGGRETENLDQ